MDRRDFIKSSLTAASALSIKAHAAKPTSTPNLVFVFPDQMRAHAMGFMKEDPVHTPVLDRFAKESLVLKQAVSNYPVCSPYRAMLMSGKYPHSNKVTSNCTSATTPLNCELQQNDVCWSDVLSKQGYDLGYIGKWHLEGPRKPFVESYNNSDSFAWNEWTPPERRHGFTYWHAYNTFDRHMTPEYWSTDMTRDERLKVKKWGPEHEADLAIDYIKNEDGKVRDNHKPFALVVSMNPPHTPYNQYPEKYRAPYDNLDVEDLCNRKNIPGANTKWGAYYRKNIRNYFGNVTGVDDQFGRILKAIDESGQRENTIVVFTSDHGDCVGIHEHSTKNVHWEEAMRVPFLIRWPEKLAAREDDLLINSPDIYPTLLDLMGLGVHIPKEVEGISRASILKDNFGDRPAFQPYYWIQKGKPHLGRRGIRTHRHTLMIEKYEDKPTETILHDNEKDPYQLLNVAKQHPEIVQELIKTKLTPWLEKTNDPWL